MRAPSPSILRARTASAPRHNCSRFNAAIICRISLSRSKCDDFSRIHKVLRVEGMLDRTHCCKRLAVLGFKVFHLSLTDAMLAGAGALHGERAFHEPLAERLGGRDLGRVVHVEQHRGMEIAV